MKIIKTITIDLASKGVPSVVDVMQDDAMTRKVEISMYSSGREFRLSGEENVSVAFIKPDGKKGWYDTLPNGEPAVDVDYDTENKIMVTLAPAMLEIPGEVKVAIVFKDPNNYQLASFPFVVNVEQNPAASSQISNEYYNIKTFDEFYAKLLTTFIAAGSDIELSGHKIGGISELVFPGSHQEEFVSITTDHASRDTPALVFSGLDDGNEIFNPPVLRHVSDGIEDNDAATVGQLNAAIGDIETALDSKTGYVTLAETILTEDANEIIWTQGANGEVLSDYKDFFIFWVGKFDVAANGQSWRCRANSGSIYFCSDYIDKLTTNTAFWWSIEEIANLPDGRTLWKTTYPDKFLKNMITDFDYGTQGLGDNIRTVKSNIACVGVNIGHIRFGSEAAGSKMVAGSKAVLLGRKR